MKEFIEKLIGMLEEKENEAVLKAPNTSDISNTEYQKWMMKSYGFKESIEIVNQLAEEYRQDLDKNSQGWIPCSSGTMPNENETIMLTFKNSAGLHVGEATYKNNMFFYVTDTEFGYYEEVYKNPIAWKTKDAPYQPKGE